ncbi:MAG: Holliday junction branch migration protein RuvA [Planctomycetota bacterium]|nr:MAG: Holliday junction branch migration protein RuvA [Planctomycetota bacterium]
MYEYLRGTVASAAPTEVVLDVGGVGYRLTVPVSTYEAVRAAAQQGGAYTLLTHLAVRENEWRLFGFATAAERRLFEALVEVKGIGPVMALHILSASPPAEIVRAIREGDSRFLHRVRGVGRKTAERVIVELREKADRLLPEGPRETSASLPAADDATRALVSLGYSAQVARRAVERAEQEAGGERLPVEMLIKRALQHVK